MSQSIKFKQPTPKTWLMNLLTPFNKIFFLKGVPVLRDVPGLNAIPGIRGLARVRNIDFPLAEQEKLKHISGKNNATFFLPNHPEFFTDWMLDKYVQSKVAPKSAAWATAAIVNGMGRRMQTFWLNNNLIAQVPGQSKLGKEYSVKAANRVRVFFFIRKGRSVGMVIIFHRYFQVPQQWRFRLANQPEIKVTRSVHG